MASSAATLEPIVGSAAWNRVLNRTHDMAALRARSGRVVHAIEERRRAEVAARILALRPRVVVDVGCEDGWIAERYAPLVPRVVLADIDPDVLARSAVGEMPNVERVVADARDPAPLLERVGPGGADVVVLSALLEHVPDPGAVLDALAPLLRRGGRFAIYVPADGPILLAKGILRAAGLRGLVRGLSLEPAPGHLHRFDRARLVPLLAPRGHVEQIEFDPATLGYHAILRRP